MTQTLLSRGLTVFARLSLLIGAVSLLAVSGCQRQQAPDLVGAFLEKHWQDPVPAQGKPPAHFGPVEASLAPEACATCHAKQHEEWRTALHSHTMGAGILWQLELLGQEESNRCLRCHAPLAEQKALVARAQGWGNVPTAPPPAYVPETLAASGLNCAACHVRGHQRFGPPARVAAVKDAPHAGFTASTAFQDSRFCANCHQFPEDGPRLAGKLREDTYQQWLASGYAGKQTCQNCHMPDRKHHWRGIHDPDMLRRALAVELKVARLDSGAYRVEVVARNQGAGHHLPTYMVPKIDLVLSLHQPGASPIELARDVIGWKADMEMRREAFDTRLPAGSTRQYAHTFKAPGKPGWHVELRVEVAPREHYERMFRHSLINISMSQASSELLKTAIAEAATTHYTAMRLTASP